MEIKIIHLGCPKNIVDSEYICGYLLNKGYILTEKKTDIFLINTCGFIKDAIEESEKLIEKLIKKKKKIIVYGCLVNRLKEKFDKKVDGVVSIGNFKCIVNAI